ncbi:myeloid leukemia factor isoform X2 [Manduca sexta]|uniref:myeloid leukemia factor isoform X2 n=1 Tax=Manduca sexta TaxID=7130 RepID=UPI00188F3097|nr:myeloid leukemia factor isoform X2 [Manduca sexta]
MSLFGSLMADVEEDPFFGSHMRHMRQMNNMMNSLFSDPFGMLGGEGPLAIAGPRHGSALMPFMPQMPSLNRLFRDLDHGQMNAGSSFSSSTVVMSSGPNGKPQVISSTSSTKIGPGGIKETRKTMQDSRTGTKKMSIGHHIGERAHVIEREQNVYTGDAEERQEFINLDEEEAVDFDREFHNKAGASGATRARPAVTAARAPRLALPAPPAPAAPPAHTAHTAHTAAPPKPACTGSAPVAPVEPSPRRARAARRPLRPSASPLILPSSSNVREVYSSSHPQRHRHKVHKANRHSPNHN